MSDDLKAQPPAETIRTEVRDGTGGQRLVFEHPVGKVLRLWIDGQEIPNSVASATRLGAGISISPGFWFTPAKRELRLYGYLFTRRAGNVRITYTAAEPVATRRDLLTLASRVREFASELTYAEIALNAALEGDRDEAEARAAALDLLRSVREGVAESIAELEGES